MNRVLRYLVGLGLVVGVVLLPGDNASGFMYFVANDTTLVWPDATSVRWLSPTTFPEGSDPDILILESMILWNIVPGSDFEYLYDRPDQDYTIDHFDGYNDTAAVAPSELDPGTIAVTVMVHGHVCAGGSRPGKVCSTDADCPTGGICQAPVQWGDMDIMFSAEPAGGSYTLNPNPDCEVVSDPLTYGFSFLLVAVHEMGHALGLGHNPVGDEPPGTPWFIATMNPGYPAGGPVGQLNIVEVHTDDRNGLRFLYPNAVPEPPVHDLALAGYSTQDSFGSPAPLYFAPSSMAPGEELIAHSVIENFGSANETGVRQGFYLSSDPVIDVGDELIGALIWDLDLGSAAQFEALIPLTGDTAAGTYYLGAILDDLDEVDEGFFEDNNAISYCQTLTVEQLAPVLESPDAQTVACGQPYHEPAPSVTHPLNMAPVAWRLDESPSGMTIDPATGVVSWPNPTPAPTPYMVTIRATNGAGNATTLLELAVTAGDTNGSGKIDLADLSAFTGCLTGPELSVNPGCECADLDGDDDVDLQDIGAFETAFEN